MVLGCVLAATSVAATWVKLTALDTDTYVSTVAPLTRDENVSLAISTRVVDDVFSAVDVESIVQRVLPSQASALAPALVAVLQRYAVQLVDDVIQSDRFQSAWVTANRIAHTQLVKLLNGELIPSQTKDRVSEVVLDLQGVVDQLRTKLAVVGIELPKLDVSQTHAGQFVVAKRAQLDTIRQAVHLLDRLAFVLPILMLVLFLLAIWLSANRARTIMWIGLGSLLALGVLAVVLRYVRRDLLGRVHDDLTRSAVSSIWSDVFAGLRVQVAVVAVLSLLVAFAGWFLGGSRAATWGRRAVERDLGRVRGGHGFVSGGFATFVGRYRRPIQFAAVGAGILILLVATKLTLGLVLLAAVVVIVVLVLVELLAGPSTPEPAPEP